MQNLELEPLGIPSTGFEYMKITDSQNPLKEFLEIHDFLQGVAVDPCISEFQGPNKNIRFINYGDTELVYVLSVGDRKYTLLLGQPSTKFGTVKTEHDNLKRLKKSNAENVVAPIHYFSNSTNTKELFVTPYLHQARCIACDDDDGWGVYVPEPDYHFRPFLPQERSKINSSMIALLVQFFDSKNNLGVASCKIGGGDFMLEKELESEDFTCENIVKRMKLIAARELVSVSLEEYLNIIRREFSVRTYYRSEAERDKSVIVNHKCRVPMTPEEIEKGIAMGMILRARQEKQTEK